MSSQKENFRKMRALWHESRRLPLDPQRSSYIDFINAHSGNIISANAIEQPNTALVVTAYNEGKSLPGVLASINNTIGRVSSEEIRPRVLVVDNASTDISAEIARSFGAEVLFESQQGIGYARQAGLLATSDSVRHVLSTDADCIVHPDWINQHVQALRVHGTVMTFSHTRYMPETNERPVSLKISLALYGPISRFNRAINTRIPSRRYVSSANMAFDRSTAIKVGGYNVNLARGEDVELMHQMSSYGNIIYVPGIDSLTSDRRVASRSPSRTLWTAVKRNFDYYARGGGMIDNEYENVR